ncbi:MAG: hypothetical protein OEV48_14880 [Acidobacteriota bacterium]|nr:hypothetical protein [Acidobacteriota bacterium]
MDIGFSQGATQNDLGDEMVPEVEVDHGEKQRPMALADGLPKF